MMGFSFYSIIFQGGTCTLIANNMPFLRKSPACWLIFGGKSKLVRRWKCEICWNISDFEVIGCLLPKNEGFGRFASFLNLEEK